MYVLYWHNPWLKSMLFQVEQHLLIFYGRNLRREVFYIVCRVIKQCLAYIFHLPNQFFRVFYNLCECIGDVIAFYFFWIIEAIQLSEISLIGLFKVLLDVSKVDDIAITIVLVWSIDTCECLQRLWSRSLRPK